MALHLDALPACVCGSVDREPGFVDDMTYRTRWFVGRLRTGPLGGTQRAGRRRYYLHGARCSVCGRVELFAHDPD